MGTKVDVTGEDFVSSPEEIAAEVAADTEGQAAAQPEGTTEDGAPEPDDGVFADEGAPTETQETGTDEGPKPYVSRDPDYISSTFTRELPCEVPDEEMASHAAEQARLYGVREKAIQDKKAFTRSCNKLIKDAEEKLLEISKIVESGTEERPVVCRWEFDYTAGIKRLRRLDSFHIADEETLRGEELQRSLNFDGSSESAVEQLRALQGDSVEHTPLTDDLAPEPTDEPYRPSNGDEGDWFRSHFCDRCKIELDFLASGQLGGGCMILLNTMAHDVDDPKYPKEWITNETDGPRCTAFVSSDAPDEAPVATATEEPAQEPAAPKEAKEPSKHACKICGFDGNSHVYLVRHLRDVHDMKLSDYKAQFPS